MDKRLEDILSLLPRESIAVREAELSKVLNDLKLEIEENELVHGIPQKMPSSVALPKDASYFASERKRVIDRLLEVSEAQPIVLQADIMLEEMNACSKSEYTGASIPLLLHQYFSNRMHDLVQAKYMHMLRWKRFCNDSGTVESLHSSYQQRLLRIMTEYKDCTRRSARLSVARESVVAGNDLATYAVQGDDLLIYLRWLVCQFHSTKLFNQYLKILEWFHVIHKADVTHVVKPKEEEDETMQKFTSRYDDQSVSLHSSRARTPSRPPSSVAGQQGGNALLDAQGAYLYPAAPPLVNPAALASTSTAPGAYLLAATAAGGSQASDEALLRLPLHCNSFESLKSRLSFLVQLYEIESSIEDIHSTADEMEMYAAVLRVFRKAFYRQESLNTFKTYDKVENVSQNWGVDHSSHALLKESGWLPYVRLTPAVDPQQEREMVRLRHAGCVDELLRIQSRFLAVTDPEKVLDTLKEHANAVRMPAIVKPIAVRSTRQADHTAAKVWHKIYTNPALLSASQPGDSVSASMDATALDAPTSADQDAAAIMNARNRRQRDSYDYGNTVQMLGLDEGEDADENAASAQGGYLSYLYLRHLRLRDLQRTCLGLLNYFRSVERTLTINDNGLFYDGGSLKTSELGHRKDNWAAGGVGGGGGESRAYMFNSLADYRMDETAFMEFTEVENHDDFYSIDEGRVHVQDHRGYFIVYDVAVEDMRKLQADLLLIASHYIEKDKELRNSSNVIRPESAKKAAVETSAGDFEIPAYGHQEVDRFDVLLDLWSNEACFMENKKHLLDSYFEAYHHVFDREEKRSLAMAMTNVIHKRPRFDFSSNYFLKTYRLENVCLRLQTNLVRSVLDRQIEEEREYSERVLQSVDAQSEASFGLPFPIIPKQAVSLNFSRAVLKNVFILEFHPSLAVAAKLPAALNHAFWELRHIHKPETVTDALLLERKLLEAAIKDWEDMPTLGASYSQYLQKELFADVYIEEPQSMCAVAVHLLSQHEEQDSKKTKKEKQAAAVTTVGKVMELVTLRHRLVEAAWETEILSKIYRHQATEMGYDECHLFLRFLQFEYAVYKEGAGKPPPLFITAVQEDDSSVDRLIPNCLPLAVNELEESTVGRFSFRSKESVLQLLRPSGLENIRTVLIAQVVHKNALVAAVQQAHVCQPFVKIYDELATADSAAGRLSPTETKSEKSSLTMLTGWSAGTRGMEASAAKVKLDRSMRSPEAFVSLQLEKVPCRDVMLNSFLDKKKSLGVALKNPDELDKLKRELLNEFSVSFGLRALQYSLRGQLIHYYNGIMSLLKQHPSIKVTYFMIGEPGEKKSESDSVKGLEPDPRVLKKRPRRVMSEDGAHVLNVWFIPHHSEVLTMLKRLDPEAARAALSHLVTAIGALHHIMQQLCAHARLGGRRGGGADRRGGDGAAGDGGAVSADWGGTEGIGAELREIQKQMNCLPNPTDPAAVSRFLVLRRDVMFLTVDTAIRHSMRDTFLSSGNTAACQSLAAGSHHALPALSNVQRPALSCCSACDVPEPLEARDAAANALYPWRSLLGRGGPYPTTLWQSHLVEHYLQMCLSGLRDVDRHVAHGEILGVSLLFEDVLAAGNQDSSTFVALSLPLPDNDDASMVTSMASFKTSKKAALSRPTSSYSVVSSVSRSGVSGPRSKPATLSRTQQPVESYELLKHFLLLWKRVEILKLDWGRRRLGVQSIDDSATYKEYSKEYKEQKLFPVLQSIARRIGHSDMYDGVTHDTEPLATPPGVSDVEIRAAQLLKLVESLDEFMIAETIKKLTKDLNQVFAERGREEGSLPTDLWKKPNWRENFTIQRPDIVEKFAEELHSSTSEAGDTVSIPRSHLQLCLSHLATDVMARERFDYENYSSYYEGLLKMTTQLLHQREQDVKHARQEHARLQSDMDVEVQCRLADKCHALVLEVTALRAKVAEMRELSLTQERDLRERVREEYNDLVQNLFQAVYTLRGKLDEHREEIFEDIHSKINAAAEQADKDMAKLTSKMGFAADEQTLQKRREEYHVMSSLRKDNLDLEQHISKMKVFYTWKMNRTKDSLRRQLTELAARSERHKKSYVGVKMAADEEKELLRQQIAALRKALADSEREARDIRRKLDKETKARKEKLYAAMQQAASERQLQLAKQATAEKMAEELEQKELLVRHLATEHERAQQLQHVTQQKARKDASAMRRALNHERSLKLDAFQRVDELQSYVYDVELQQLQPPPLSHRAVSPTTVAAQTAPLAASAAVPAALAAGLVRAHTVAGYTSTSGERVQSASATRRMMSASGRNGARGAAAGGAAPKQDVSATTATLQLLPWSGTRVPSADIVSNARRVLQQRPKTTAGRLRSKMAEYLLNDLDPSDTLKTISQLEAAFITEVKK